MTGIKGEDIITNNSENGYCCIIKQKNHVVP